MLKHDNGEDAALNEQFTVRDNSIDSIDIDCNLPCVRTRRKVTTMRLLPINPYAQSWHDTVMNVSWINSLLLERTAYIDHWPG